ncbi:MAG: QueT transporter family protein [Clostridia bacterium]|nr:QueT transporter family protein [Clostridia bacterium]
MKRSSTKRKAHTLFLLYAAVIGALYAALTFVFGAFSFGMIQFRVSEVLTILPFFTPAAIPGLTVGCLVANLITGNIFDIIFGTLATLVAALLSYLFRKNSFLVTIPPVVINALVIPFILKFTYPDCEGEALWLMMLTVGAGQALACCAVGYPLLLTLKKRGTRLFTIKS